MRMLSAKLGCTGQVFSEKTESKTEVTRQLGETVFFWCWDQLLRWKFVRPQLKITFEPKITYWPWLSWVSLTDTLCKCYLIYCSKKSICCSEYESWFYILFRSNFLNKILNPSPMSNFWREIQNGLSDCKYWGISEKILRKEYFRRVNLIHKVHQFETVGCSSFYSRNNC